MRSCGKDVYKVEKSKEDTCEPWKFRRRNFSMTSEEFWMGPEIIHVTIAKGSFTVLYNMMYVLSLCKEDYFQIYKCVSFWLHNFLQLVGKLRSRKPVSINR